MKGVGELLTRGSALAKYPGASLLPPRRRSEDECEATAFSPSGVVASLSFYAACRAPAGGCLERRARHS